MTVTTPGMTTQDAFCSQDQAQYGAVCLQCLDGIGGASGGVTAGFGQPGGNDQLVDPHRDNQQEAQARFYPAKQEEVIDFFSSPSGDAKLTIIRQ